VAAAVHEARTRLTVIKTTAQQAMRQGGASPIELLQVVRQVDRAVEALDAFLRAAREPPAPPEDYNGPEGLRGQRP
jgi:hypothetical protein